MLGRNWGLPLLQQCAESQPWAQQCCCMGIACLSTSAAVNVAEAASTVVQQAAHGATSGPSSSNSSSRPISSSSRPLPPGHQYLHLTFEQLHDNVQQSLALKNAQSEMKLRVLIEKACSPDQVQAAVAALRHNYMKRCRLQHVEQFGPEVLHELWRAGKKVELGNDFAVQLLEQANSLGVRISLGLCEEVIRSCLKQNNYLAASRAWLYAKAYCSTQAASSPATAAAGGDATPAVEAEVQKGSDAAWASKNMIRLYLSGMTDWLKQGGLGLNHQKSLRLEVQQLAQELAARGANVAWVQKVLQDVDSSSSADVSGAAKGGAGDEVQADVAQQPSAA